MSDGDGGMAEVRRRLAEAEEALVRGSADAAARERILARRTRAVAARREAARLEGERVLAFAVGGERYALPAAAVSLVLHASALGPLLGSPPWLLGAVVARSRLVPVVDLRPLLRLTGGGLSDLTRILVVERAGEPLGIAVEELLGEREVPADQTTPAEVEGPIRWIAADRTALLDSERLVLGGEGG